MNDWGWVATGYAAVYGVIALYAAYLLRRLGTARRAAGEEPPGVTSSGAE